MESEGANRKERRGMAAGLPKAGPDMHEEVRGVVGADLDAGPQDGDEEEVGQLGVGHAVGAVEHRLDHRRLRQGGGGTAQGNSVTRALRRGAADRPVQSAEHEEGKGTVTRGDIRGGERRWEGAERGFQVNGELIEPHPALPVGEGQQRWESAIALWGSHL